MNRTSLFASIMIASFRLAVFAVVSAPAYIFRSSGNYPGTIYTIPSGIGSAHIVGYSLDGTGAHAYIQTGSAFLRAEPAGVTASYLSGINKIGLAVGAYCPQNCNPLTGQSAYTYDLTTGTITAINFPGIGTTTAAYGINDLGQVVGATALVNTVVLLVHSHLPFTDSWTPTVFLRRLTTLAHY